ncbi:ATP-binding protein [Micromonospora krabiensis]|uniref:histidine kinase n=1 Tax=Micromonospora krabiensis TaxID=307121 RepID=A0A1C3MXN3_9ACTN|nr:HAMP domain-containing sensor histidine kinase [Micromonospora krabiensis]SBV25079.1 two-component system, OmpR family, sensor histidine kinase MtrB [Micromonospora krabiensis]
MRRWPGPRAAGLRVRLLLAFVLLGLLTTAAVAGGSYFQARNVILQQAQDAAVVSLVDQLAEAYPIRQLPPTQEDLDRVAQLLSDRDGSAIVRYHDLTSWNGGMPDPISPELRQEVQGDRVVWQRVSFGGMPALVIGVQLRLERPDGTTIPSGVEVYAVRSLVAEQQSIDRLATWAWLTGGLSLLFAAVLATVAASGVLRPVRELGRAAHRLGAGDLTTRLAVRGSDELTEVARTFNHTAELLERQVGELRRMEADARRFVADVSHELRTPLAAMTAVTDVLDEEADRLPGDAGQAARLVSQETQRLTLLVNDLIEVSRFDSGTARLALDDIDVAAAVTATLRARGWADRVRTDLPAGIVARLDPRRLDVIVANLVGNAFRHGTPPVWLRLSAESGWITIEVGDNGPGLDPEVLPHVFDRFYKADTARTRSEGSGLGLAIAWENARLHRYAGRTGALVAANGPAGGAVFTLHLPSATADPTATDTTDPGGVR